MTRPFKPRSILVIRLRHMGDVLMTAPAVAALKARFPDASIDFMAEPGGAEVLEGNPHLRRVHRYVRSGPISALRWMLKIHSIKYDCVIDYYGNPRSALLSFFSGAKIRVGHRRVSHRFAYNRFFRETSDSAYQGSAKIDLLSELGISSSGADFIPRVYLARKPSMPEDVIGLIPGSHNPLARWPADSYARLGRLLREKYGCKIWIFGGSEEKNLPREIAAEIGSGAQAVKTASVKELAEKLARCRLIVANSTGPSHIAMGLGIPTLMVCGRTNPAAWVPPDPRYASIRRDELPCIGCEKNSCPYDLECMTGLGVERVFAAARRLLDKERQPA